MSDMSKKSQILQVLTEPGGDKLTNPVIAKRVGCDAKLVRTVRSEMRTLTLMAENERLKQELAEAIDRLLATQQGASLAVASAPAPVKPTRPRKQREESYPLFESILI